MIFNSQNIHLIAKDADRKAAEDRLLARKKAMK